MTGWFAHGRDRAWTCAPPTDRAFEFHRQLAGYSPTPLVELPALAGELGVGSLFAKDESQRLGLPAFKALGASWAVQHVVEQHDPAEPLTFVAATDGNHGRAVARFARLLGYPAEIHCPRGVSPAALTAITDEGATLVTVDASYDEVVAQAARRAEADGYALVQDTAWAGYEGIPRVIVEGYDTMLREIDAQLDGREPDLVLVPTGVGSLLQAVLVHYRAADRDGSTAVVAVEPEAASCMPPSLTAGRPVSVDTGVTTMAGLNCGTPSELAWPYIQHGLDGVAVVSDADAESAITVLESEGVHAGPCGAASLAALRRVIAAGGDDHLGLGPDSTVVLLITEGAKSS